LLPEGSRNGTLVNGQPVTEVQPAELSARPADFANASPFPGRKEKQDRARTAILAAVGLAFVAFLASMIALALMRPPAF
jgi:hypothetical protein